MSFLSRNSSLKQRSLTGIIIGSSNITQYQTLHHRPVSASSKLWAQILKSENNGLTTSWYQSVQTYTGMKCTLFGWFSH